MNKILSSSIAVFVMVASAQAAIVEFDLLGKAGAGLLPGNENGTINGIPGTGGELAGGIFYNTDTNIMSLDVGWGTGHGFLDLTTNANVGHLHGPTTLGGVGSFTQNASVKYNLFDQPGWDPSASNGEFTGVITILEADEAALLNRQFYVNVHTPAPNNPGGEIRGNLVVVPEPASFGLLACGALALVGARRRGRI